MKKDRVSGWNAEINNYQIIDKAAHKVSLQKKSKCAFNLQNTTYKLKGTAEHSQTSIRSWGSQKKMNKQLLNI